MIPIALTDRQMHEVKQAAQIVPLDLRSVFLERLAAELRGKDLGDGLVHRGRTLNHMGRRADSNGGGLAMTRTEVWRDCRNVEGGWRCVTEHGEELFIRYRSITRSDSTRGRRACPSSKRATLVTLGVMAVED